MPRGDRTGPEGFGPMTGRAAGYCAGYPTPGFMNPAGGRGLARGYGRGIGRGMAWRGPGYGRGGYRGFSPYYPEYASPPPQAPPYYSPEGEINTLKQQADYMEKDLKAIHERIKELEEGQEQE